jgi:hypothetical protein
LAREGVQAVLTSSTEAVLAIRRCGKGKIFVKFDFGINYRHRRIGSRDEES